MSTPRMERAVAAFTLSAAVIGTLISVLAHG